MCQQFTSEFHSDLSRRNQYYEKKQEANYLCVVPSFEQKLSSPFGLTVQSAYTYCGVKAGLAIKL